MRKRPFFKEQSEEDSNLSQQTAFNGNLQIIMQQDTQMALNSQNHGTQSSQEESLFD